jgi:hypothetical protein
MEVVEIRVKGQIDKSWSNWLGNLDITFTENGDTILTGRIRDQAATYGVLEKIYSLGMKLISVTSNTEDSRRVERCEN